MAAVAILLVATGVRWSFFDVTTFRGDELIYLKYARSLNDGGLAQFEQFAREYSATPALWVYPPPTRVLYVLVAALGCRLVEPCSGRGIALTSLASGIALVAVTMAMAGRMFGPAVGLLGGLLVAVSPLELQLSRRALQDGFFSLTVLLALWAFWERSRSPRRAWDVLLGCALVASFLTKESSLLIPLVLFVALLHPSWFGLAPGRSNWSTLAAVALPLPVAAVVILVLIPPPLAIAVLGAWRTGAETGAYAIAYSQGPWFRYLLDFLILSPLTAVAAIGYYFRPDPRPEDRFLGRVTLVLFLIFGVLPLKNIRYVSFLDMPVRVLAVLTLASLLRDPAVPDARRGRLVLAVVVLAAHDLWLFYAIFVRAGVYDPVTATLARAVGLIP